MKVFLFYEMLVTRDGKRLTIGGIQSYLIALGNVIQQFGGTPIIVQDADVDFDFDADGVTVWGRVTNQRQRKIHQALFERVQEHIDPATDLIIWGTSYFIPRKPKHTTILIQHGIGFDRIQETKKNQLAIQWGLGWLLKSLQRREALKWIGASDFVVCVDYNFLNWYRTFSVRDHDENFFVIPNFADVPTEPRHDKSEFRKILFARRFVEKRGVHLMIDACRELLPRYPKLHVTFAGEGPLAFKVEQLQQEFPKQISITTYDSSESLAFHANFDIAVVPTHGSEGTSLSLLEAMAAGCAVVCSNVGGMTNIVIDQFNGLMIQPMTREIIASIEYLILNPDIANRLRKAAHATVLNGFSRALWAERWSKVLEQATKHLAASQSD